MVVRPINGLALCAGIGGLELGLQLALGDSYRCVGYVEREAFAAAALVARMEDEALDQAPIWDDLATFDGRPWCGKVDLVSAGFPCQPWSQAGKRRRERDPRHVWGDIARITHEVKPMAVFLENVSTSAFREPLRDLRAMGFTVEDPLRLRASYLGAPHHRGRTFVLAHTCGEPLRLQPGRCGGQSREEAAELAEPSWWEREPGLDRLDHGTPASVDRLRCLGNAVVPLQAAHAFRTLAVRGGLT